MAQATEVIQALTFWQGVKQNLAEVLGLKGWFCSLWNLSQISPWFQSEQDQLLRSFCLSKLSRTTKRIQLCCTLLQSLLGSPSSVSVSSSAAKTFYAGKGAAFVRFWVINSPGLVVPVWCLIQTLALLSWFLLTLILEVKALQSHTLKINKERKS